MAGAGSRGGTRLVRLVNRCAVVINMSDGGLRSTVFVESNSYRSILPPLTFEKVRVSSDLVRIFQGARIALHLSFLCATLDLKCAFFCITLLMNSSMDAQISHL